MYYNVVVVVVALVGSARSLSLSLSLSLSIYNSRVQSGFCPAHLDRLQGKTRFRFITNRCHYNIIIYTVDRRLTAAQPIIYVRYIYNIYIRVRTYIQCRDRRRRFYIYI